MKSGVLKLSILLSFWLALGNEVEAGGISLSSASGLCRTIARAFTGELPRTPIKPIKVQRRRWEEQSEELRKEISDFVDRMPIITIPHKHNRDIWKKILFQISQINFNRKPYDFAWQHPMWDDERYFYLDDGLVEGWRELGLINSQGRFNFHATPEEIAKAFENKTGIEISKRTNEKGSPDFSSPQEFSVTLLEGSGFLFDDIHDILIHAPYMMVPFRREMARISAEFLILEFEYIKGIPLYPRKVPLGMEIQNDFFEGGFTGLEPRRIIGATPLVIEIKAQLPFTDYKTALKKIQQYPYPMFPNLFSTYENDYMDWHIPLLAMQKGIAVWLKVPELPAEVIEQAKLLLQKINAQIKFVESQIPPQ
jgi:hypothetical protein